jgi:hypothetical protein
LRDISEMVNRSMPFIERSCLSKALFISQREARSVVRHGRHQDGSVQPYRCRFADHWHLGHRRRRRVH